MRDMLDIECLVQSLENVVKAKHEHDIARDAYTGYSWGYHGHCYVKAMEDAAEDFGSRLNKYIEQKVRTILLEAK